MSSSCFITASLLVLLSERGAYELRGLKSFFGNRSPPLPSLKLPPAGLKQSLQYTGFPLIGRNGTSHSLLHSEHVALCNETGPSLDLLPPQFFLLKPDAPERLPPNEGFPPLPAKLFPLPRLLYSVIVHGVCTFNEQIARGRTESAALQSFD